MHQNWILSKPQGVVSLSTETPVLTRGSFATKQGSAHNEKSMVNQPPINSFQKHRAAKAQLDMMEHILEAAPKLSAFASNLSMEAKRKTPIICFLICFSVTHRG